MQTFSLRVLKNIKKLSREELEKLLENSYQQKLLYTNLINSISQAIFITNNSHVVLDINNATKRYIKKYRRYEGKKILDIIANDEIKKQIQTILNYGKHDPNKTSYLEFSIYEKQELIFGLSRFPLHNFNSKNENDAILAAQTHSTGNVIILTDITQLKKMYSQQTQKTSMASLNMLMASIAHEIKNPLGALDLHLQLIGRLISKNNFPKKNKLNELLHIVKMEISRLDRIANDFLTHFRIESSIKKEENLNDIVGHSIEVMLPRLNDHNILLKIERSDSMKPFAFDKNQIHQLIINLLENAIDAICQSDNKGKITITTKHFSNRVVLEIKDNGCGIEKENIEKIFNPFYSKNTAGTGLGLPIIKKIANHHNGKIEVTTSLGHGSTFKIIFYKFPLRSNMLQLAKK